MNLGYPGPDGQPLCKAGVLDIDEGPDSLAKAQTLLGVAKAQGLSVRVAWSGSKGCHVWLFTEPAPVALVQAALKKLKAAVPFDGETIPGDNVRAKLPPARHQVVQRWAFWFDTLPNVAPNLENPPTGFLGAQAAILEVVTPTPLDRLEAFVGEPEQQPEHAPADDMAPDLGKLGNELAPCMVALMKQGAQPALGTWDKNALTLARYAVTAGIPADTAREMLRTLSQNTGPDFDTTKDEAARLQHWGTIHAPGPFGCGFVLSARQALGFDCGQCAARPPGVRFGRGKPLPDTASEDTEDDVDLLAKTVSGNATMTLEPALADSLLQIFLQEGEPEERINTAIFAPVALPGTDAKTGKPIQAPLHALACQAVAAGHPTPAAMLNWLERQKEPPTAPVRQALAALVVRLTGAVPLEELEADALLTRAADLSARLELLAALGTGSTATKDRKPLAGVLGNLQTATFRLQQAAGTAWGAPLTAYADELLENLVTTDKPCIPTPFDTLNNLLGGGLHGGKLYVLAAPPGGGKTTLAAQVADAAAAAQIPACYVALEMGRGQLFDYALARRLGMNSAKVEARSFNHSEDTRRELAEAAREYLEQVAPWLTFIEGAWDTTAALLGTWVAQARARYELAPKAPVLVVVDYLQLLNTGDEKLDSGPNETPKVSTVAVQLKQLARDTGAAVLALSDIIKSEQGDAIKSGKEFTLNAIRGSNRVAHAADTVFALYSEPAAIDGGKALLSPWEMLAAKLGQNQKAAQFKRALDDTAHAHPTGGPGAVVHARLELLKNRGGRGRGSQILLYERAFHRFKGLSLAGQDDTEGRG
ncbi:replicative DNA helicase [Gammaproteobacteria bacterium]